MSKITIWIPSMPQRSYAYRRGDAQIIHDDEKNAIIIDGGEDEICNQLIKYCKNHGITHVTYILSHWHPDHDRGMKLLLDSSIIVDKIICPPPSDLTRLSDKSDYSRAMERIAQATRLEKPISYPPAETYTDIKVGAIVCRIWRRAPKSSENYDYQVNNTSLCCYFPELLYLTTGDTINAFETFLNKEPGPITVFKIPHHGNACTSDPCELLKAAGAQLCWYNHAEAYGVSIGGDGFSKWGAAYCKKHFITLRPFYAITMTACAGKLAITQNGSRWSYPIPYAGEAFEGWLKGTKGWWYQFKDGSWAQGWAKLKWSGGEDWFYFNVDGWMMTGWVKNNGYWYYLDPETGAMVTGWQKLAWTGGEDWFYFDLRDGCCVYGWCYLTKDGKSGWFYFDDKTAKMHTGWVFVGNHWYYLAEDGVMQTGWLDWNGKKCYLEPDSQKNQGHAYRNQRATIDGKMYSFDDNCYATEIKATGNITTVSGKLNDMAASRRQFAIDIANYVRKYAPQYGICVYSPIIAQAIHESGWGESKLSAKYHNYFGLKCGTKWTGKSVNMATQEEYSAGSLTTISANFRAYDSMEEGVKGYFDFIQLPRYSNLKGVTSPRQYLTNIKNDGYATGSKYVENNMNLINLYNLTQFDVPVAEEPKKDVEQKADPVDLMIQIMDAELGYHEGANNHTKYGDEMHSIQPSNMDKNAAWCDCWFDWCVLQLCKAFGYDADMAREVLCGDFDDYTYSSINLYKRQGRWFSSPQKGDQIFFGGAGHTGGVVDVKNGEVHTDEGNKSDQVMRCVYKLGDSRIIGYGRPRYELLSGGLTAENMPLVKKGSTGFAVTQLQKMLNSVEYSGKQTLTVDGDFGNKTYNAVKAYQKDRGLEVDGEVGKNTWKSLFGEV